MFSQILIRCSSLFARRPSWSWKHKPRNQVDTTWATTCWISVILSLFWAMPLARRSDKTTEVSWGLSASDLVSCSELQYAEGCHKLDFCSRKTAHFSKHLVRFSREFPTTTTHFLLLWNLAQILLSIHTIIRSHFPHSLLTQFRNSKSLITQRAWDGCSCFRGGGITVCREDWGLLPLFLQSRIIICRKSLWEPVSSQFIFRNNIQYLKV